MRARALERRAATLLAGLLAAALLIPVTSSTAVAASGTGPYPAEYVTTLRLRNHTIFRPATLPSNEKLPIVVWGNGACLANGTMFENKIGRAHV